MIRERDRQGQSKLKMADGEGMWGTANIELSSLGLELQNPEFKISNCENPEFKILNLPKS